MQVRSSRETLQTPTQLDTRFGAVAGLYVATLVSPALLFVAMQWLNLDSELVVLGLLGAVGMTLTAAVAWQVTCWGGLVAWFNSPWVAFLVTSVGILPMFAYAFQAFVYIAITVADLQAESTASFVGFIGFFLGFVACCLGGVLVPMARTRLVNATVDASEVDTEWTAGWPRQDRFKLVIGALVIVGVSYALAFWQLGLQGVTMAGATGTIPMVGIHSLASERTYRVTPVGLEQRREARWVESRQLRLWSQFDGFSVTDRAIILHRQLPHFDIRCSRRDLIDDDQDVIAALETHLDRRDS